MNPSFWDKRKVLITGHTGFKGSWLALWLQKLGANVVGYSLRPPTSDNLFELANIGQGMKTVSGDVRNYELLHQTILREKPEVIFHLAAQPLVGVSYSQPGETYSTNIMGTVNLLEAVRQADGVRVLINVTTDKCYENKDWVWGYRENEPLGGHDPYSSSKACSEIVTAAYYRSFFRDTSSSQKPLPAVATARAGNVIGGGDWAQNRLIPDIMKAVLANKEVLIRSPRAIRPWQFVLEPLHGYLTLAEELWKDGARFSEPWNFGPLEHDVQNVLAVVQKLARLWGPELDWRCEESSAFHEANFLRLDCSKARAHLHWGPKTHLETALQWIVEWYKAFQADQNVRDITERQISRFQTMEIV